MRHLQGSRERIVHGVLRSGIAVIEPMVLLIGDAGACDPAGDRACQGLDLFVGGSRELEEDELLFGTVVDEHAIHEQDVKVDVTIQR